MKFTKTGIEGVLIVDLDLIEDERGFFARTHCMDEFSAQGIDVSWAQANMSFTRSSGTFRGFHYQDESHAEMKYIRCTRGAVWDVAIDINKKSTTYLAHVAIELNETNRRGLIVPEHCAHGFLTLQDNCEVHYPTSTQYSPGHELGLRYDDPMLKVQWPIEVRTVSEKDHSWPLLNKDN